MCVKPKAALGVCTISSTSNGHRQDWLACPFRALDAGLLDDVARRLFTLQSSDHLVIRPATTLERDDVRAELLTALSRGGRAFVYLQAKFGGEISLRATAQSPELAFDVTLVELSLVGDRASVQRYGILEIQTMDFHGSYKHAVQNLEDALRLHAAEFHVMVGRNVGWVSDRIEGPNIANVFKRTLYQMLLKFRLAGTGACVGVALALPAAVWDSWQRNLSGPSLAQAADGTFRLAHPTMTTDPRAWIYIFDINAESTTTPNPIAITKIIGTDVESVTHYAFRAAPDAIVAEGGSGSLVLKAIRLRLAVWWPDLGPEGDKRGSRNRSVGPKKRA